MEGEGVINHVTKRQSSNKSVCLLTAPSASASPLPSKLLVVGSVLSGGEIVSLDGGRRSRTVPPPSCPAVANVGVDTWGAVGAYVNGSVIVCGNMDSSR